MNGATTIERLSRRKAIVRVRGETSGRKRKGMSESLETLTGSVLVFLRIRHEHQEAANEQPAGPLSERERYPSSLHEHPGS